LRILVAFLVLNGSFLDFLSFLKICLGPLYLDKYIVVTYSVLFTTVFGAFANELKKKTSIIEQFYNMTLLALLLKLQRRSFEDIPDSFGLNCRSPIV
jgi:hypothetical protein